VDTISDELLVQFKREVRDDRRIGDPVGSWRQLDASHAVHGPVSGRSKR
jgi:hypothetical protein